MEVNVMRPEASQHLPDFGQAYLDHVMAEYDLLPSCETPSSGHALPQHIDIILRKYGNEREQLNWGDLYLLEKYVLANQPLEVARRRLPNLRENYRELAGQKTYDAYLQSQSPQGNGSSSLEEALRADLGRLLDALHWAYSLIPKRELLRAEIIRNIGLTILLCLVPFAISFVALYVKGYKLSATIVAVLFMGALGGFVSLQQRIQDIPTDGDPILTIFQLQNGQASLYFAPPTGAIFALVLFLIFLGGLLKGALFPDVTGVTLDAANFGKLLVWSFVAGFAERFVPDTLTSLVGRAHQIQRSDTNAETIKAGTPLRETKVVPLTAEKDAPSAKDKHGDKGGETVKVTALQEGSRNVPAADPNAPNRKAPSADNHGAGTSAKPPKANESPKQHDPAA